MLPIAMSPLNRHKIYIWEKNSIKFIKKMATVKRASVAGTSTSFKDSEGFHIQGQGGGALIVGS